LASTSTCEIIVNELIVAMMIYQWRELLRCCFVLTLISILVAIIITVSIIGSTYSASQRLLPLDFPHYTEQRIAVIVTVPSYSC
jgi:hypothetical protein